MGKLTKAAIATLEACQDWSAPFEIVWRRHEATDEIVSGFGQQWLLTRLVGQGLVEYGRGNNTYRITDAGREALSLGAQAMTGKLTKGQINYLRKVEAGGVMAVRGYRKRTGGYDRFVGGEAKAREMSSLGLIRMPGVADLGRPSKATLTEAGRSALAQVKP